MKLFQNFFNKNHDLNEEEQQKFNSMVGEEESPVQNSFSLDQTISHLKTLEEINKVRNLLDNRQKEIESGTQYLVDSDISHSDGPEFENTQYENKNEDSSFVEKKSISEEIIEEPILESDLNHETYEDTQFALDETTIENTTYTDSLNKYEENTLATDSPDLSFGTTQKEVVDKNLQYEELEKEEQSIQMPDEILIKEEKRGDSIEIDLETEEEDHEFVDFDTIHKGEDKEDSSTSPEVELYLDKIRTVFGNNNVLSKMEDKNSTTYNPNKKLLHIGIRQKEQFGHGDTLEENAWFIGNIKQLEDLKAFKMLRSEQGMKDLVSEKEQFVIIISFRATSFLNSIDDFDFNL